MPAWRLRDYHDQDLDQAIGVWDESRGPGSAEPVFSVAEVMAARKHGSALVVERSTLVGIFTSTDALRALVALLRDQGREGGGAP